MIKLTIKLLCLLMVVFAVSCDTKKIETSRQLLAKEKERLNTFLNTVAPDSMVSNPEKLTWKEYWTRQAVDTVDKSKETNSLDAGLIYFENVTGTGEPVTYGKEVGYRYKRSVIDVDSVGTVGMYPSFDNYGSEDADYFVSVPNAASTGVPAGVQFAVEYMRKYGKSRVVVLSTLDNGRYKTAVYEIEITFLSK